IIGSIIGGGVTHMFSRPARRHPPGRPAALQRLTHPSRPDHSTPPGGRRRRAPRHHEAKDDDTMTTTIETGALDKALRTLKLSGMLATIEARLAQARAGELGHIDFLQVLCEDEISRRDTMSMTRRIRRARFEEQATLEGFDFTASPKLPAAQIRD